MALSRDRDSFLYTTVPTATTRTRPVGNTAQTSEPSNKKKGGRRSVSLPPETSPARALILIDQLKSEARLIWIGPSRPFLIDGSIGPVLPKLRSSQEHFGELVGSRKRHFA